MSDSTIRAVTFDAAGTLFAVAEPVGTTYARSLTRRGLAADPAAVEARFRAAFAGAPPLAFPNAGGETLEKEERAWWRRIVGAAIDPGADLDAPMREEIFDELYAVYARAAAWSLDPAAVAVLDELCRRGVRLGVISNFDSRLTAILGELGIADRFDAIVASASAGTAKPERMIFDAAVARLGTSAARTLHVGDDRRCDLEGARRAGLRSLLLDREAPPTVDSIARLDDVLSRASL